MRTLSSRNSRCIHLFFVSSLIICAFTQTYHYLDENKVYKWWDYGDAQTQYFRISTKNHTEKLCVYSTDLRSAHADGHGASLILSTHQYEPNKNLTLHVRAPAIGQGFLSVVATFSQAIELLAGIPQHVVLNSNEEFALFKFEASANSKISTISLTPFQGKPIAYISNLSTPIDPNDASTYQYKIYSHVNIKIPSNASHNYTFQILTKNANTSNKALSSRFYLTASTYHSHIMLQSGVPRTEDVDYGSNRYYYFNVTEPHCTLGVLLSVMEGDPDLFMSLSSQYPDSNHFDFSSNRLGTDFILIENASTSVYYVGTQPTGHKNAKYTLSSILKCNDHNKYFTYLIDGISQIDVLPAKQWSFYKFEFNFNHSSIRQILVQINPSSGDPDLYADIDQTNLSDPKSWRFKATQYGPDHLRLSFNDWHTICAQDQNDTFCTLDIAVFGYSSTVYTIMVVTSDAHTILSNGKPYIGYISTTDALYEYFMFDIEDMSSLLLSNNISISITPLVSTSDDIVTTFYVDTDSNPQPNQQNGYKYKSEDAAHPFLIINGRELMHNAYNELYIGVTSNQNISFSLVLTIGDRVQLSNGQLQIGHVYDHHPMYYELLIDETDESNQNIEIIISTFHGNINMYIGSRRVPDAANSTTYVFANTEHSVSIKRAMINNTDFKRQNKVECLNNLCRYFITVTTNDVRQDAEFSIIASTDYAVVPLYDGQPITAQINPNQYEYFSIVVDYSYKSHPALTIELTPISSGNVNLYVSDNDNNHRPNSTFYTFKSENSESSTDSVQITDAQQTTYYISVYNTESTQKATFSVAATLSNSLRPGYIRLLSGVPQTGTISTWGGWTARYYQIYVPEAATLLNLHVQYMMFPIIVYVTHNTTHGQPSSANHEYRMTGGTLTIPNPTEGSYFIAVYSHIVCIFTITATLSDDVLLLQDGQSINGKVAAKKYDYYQIQTHDANKDFTVSLTCFSGDADMYISLDSARLPTVHNSTWRANRYGSDLITISHDDPKSCSSAAENCVFTIAVYGYRTSAYSITATTEETIELQDGIPIQGELQSNQWHYYKFQVSNEHLTLLVGITLISGQNDLFVDINKEPTTNSYLKVSRSWNQDKNIQIEHLACPQSTDICSYYIGVHAVTSCQYSVFVQSTNLDSEFLIEDSVPITRSLGVEQSLYFRYEVMDSLQQVSITLTPISGTPQCYISRSVEKPTENNYEYKITNGANTVSVQNVTNGTVFHITMFSVTESSFTLSVIGEHRNRSTDATGMQLTEGLIQYGSTSDWAYYSFLPSNSLKTDIIISVYALSGDPDIYCNTESYPTLTRYEYMEDLDGPETLIIPHQNTTYFCGVHADNNAETQFYILVYHSHSIVTLLEDVPVIGQLNAQNNVNYYRFIAPSYIENDLISLIFTPIYSNTPCIIYVSYQAFHPNTTFHEYALNNSARDGINSLHLKINREQLAQSKNWYISIQPLHSESPNQDESALYTLLLTYDNVTQLQTGVPQDGVVSAQQEAYYVWNIELSTQETNKPLTVGVSVLNTGNCTVYLSRNPSFLNSCNHNIGCPSSLFDIAQSCSDQPLVIQPTDSYYIASKGTYYIAAVHSQESDEETYYNIFVSTAYSILYLSNALPTWNAIQLNEYRYYSVLCDEDIISLDIAVTPKRADDKNDDFHFPFILKGIVSTSRSRPTYPRQTKEFETTWIERRGAVFGISDNDASFVNASQYFFALQAVANPQYEEPGTASALTMVYTISAVASTSNTIQYLKLIDDMDQMAIVYNADHKKYYMFHSETPDQIKFVLHCAQGMVSMYIVSNANENQQNPSSDNFEFQLENVQQFTTQYITIEHPCEHCTYFLVIYASSQSVYSIRAETIAESESNDGHKKGVNVAVFYVIGVIVCVIVMVLAIIGLNNYRKNRRLRYELDIAELQLNMSGTKSLRQRREELQAVNNRPAAPVGPMDAVEISPHQVRLQSDKTKRKSKKKYSGLKNDAEDDEYYDEPMLDTDNNVLQ